MDVINAKSNTYPFVEVVIYSEILRTNCRMNQSSSHLATNSNVQSAAPPLADISIIRVHIVLVPAQIVVPEH